MRPPWAWCIINLPGKSWKDVENRSRNSLHRGPLLIHASGTLTREDYSNARAYARDVGLPYDAFPTFEALAALRGQLLGAVRMVDVSAPGYEPDDRPSSPWRDPDSFGYHLTDRIALPHRPLKGRLGLFEVEPTRAEVEALRPLWPLSP